MDVDSIFFGSLSPGDRQRDRFCRSSSFVSTGPACQGYRLPLYQPRGGGRASRFPRLTQVRQDSVMGLAETQKETDLGKPQLHVYHCVALAKLSKRMCLLSCSLKWGETIPLNVLRNHQLFEDNRCFMVENWRLGSDSLLNANDATV